MTQKLFLENQYEKEFHDKVIVVDGNKVVLDKTLFYPEGGGQPGDHGEINGIKVIDTKKDGDNIVHLLEKEHAFKVGDIVKGKIEWNRRYKLMRSHTAAHLVSSVINQKTGAEITGNQLEEDKIRIDFSLERFDKEAIAKYVEETNEILRKNLEVKVYTIPREEALKMESLTKLRIGIPDNLKMVRIVDIGGYDAQADGGTHVKNTEEIGKLELVKCENKGKNNRRVYLRLVD